ncbi:exodeoxyribonuclease III [Synechocystis sp. PCC 7338]|uniref:exodeoxyribonuclease III n=1 Tax=Synechocystis sp. PCC 7338 TaxID=2732530 RepID=UPI001BAEEDCD|nr:exodeoxyribonuclease III [Synechocystis sp. PCC 7338]QUS59650.1 exodeoxyribonuclease III [Synechocystis sp. PCC 7338]
MDIASWNVNSIRSRQQHILDWLGTNTVDVLCLQETKVVDEDFPRQPFEQAGYHCHISGQKSYNGVAIFSREPLRDVKIGFAPLVGSEGTGDLDEQKRVISGIYRNIAIVNLYVPNGSAPDSEKYSYKLRWLEALKTYLHNLSKSDTPEFLVCGDFNIALEDRDIHDPKGRENHIMSTPVERQALKDVLAIADLQDGFRKFTEETGHYSWWDYRTRGFSRNRGWRIDHHYLTPKLYAQAQKCWIDQEPRGWEKPSDHAPVVVTIAH